MILYSSFSNNTSLRDLLVETMYTPEKISTADISFSIVNLSIPAHIATIDATRGCTLLYIDIVVARIRLCANGMSKYVKKVAPNKTKAKDKKGFVLV